MPRYKIIGAREVLDHEPGDEFYADLDPVQEARLTAGGHIARVLEKDAPKRERLVEKNEKDEQSDKNEHDEQSPDEA